MRFFSVVVFLLLATITVAQTTLPALEKQVTLTVYNESVDGILQKITTQTGVKFSYNPASVKVAQKISFSVSKKPVRSVLKLCFDETIQTKQNGNYIILTYKAPKPTSKKEPIKEVKINGYIYSTDGSTIGAASIYNTENLLATISNEYGYYTLNVPVNRFPLTLKVAKENFPDTSIRIEQAEKNRDIVLVSPPPKPQPIVLKEEPQNTIDSTTIVRIDSSRTTLPDSTVVKKPISTFLQNLVLSENLKSSIRNIKDTAFRKTQIGLIPYVSTNKLLAGNTVNDYSFNILIGYAQGVNRFEIGGLMNVDRGDVKFVQAAGLFNAVGGNMTGAQLAGWGNITKGRSDGLVAGGILNIGTDLHGVQLAGIFNLNLSYPDTLRGSHFSDFLQDTVKGIQTAGIFNMNAGYTEGIRLAGIFNAGKTNKGVQIAGIMNGNGAKSSGVNVAGILNYMHDTLIGYNISCVMNVNRTYMRGLQIAGLMNVSSATVDGLQITSILNIAKHVNGSQIALLNFSDSARGLPIGLLSFVNSGYHKLEVFGDDILYSQLAFRTGVPKLHNIFNAGIDLTNRVDGLWNLGYGLGSTFAINSKWSFTTDILGQFLFLQNNFESAPLLASCFVGIEKRFHSKFSIAFGPSYHALINYSDNPMYTDINQKLVPYSFSEKTYDNGNTLNMWVGAKISLKFL